MKTTQRPTDISMMRLLMTTSLMVVAGIMAWWSWTHTGRGGVWYTIIGILIVLAAVIGLGKWRNIPSSRG